MRGKGGKNVTNFLEKVSFYNPLEIKTVKRGRESRKEKRGRKGSSVTKSFFEKITFTNFWKEMEEERKQERDKEMEGKKRKRQRQGG